MRTFFLWFALVAFIGGSTTIFVGGHMSSVPLALLGLMSIAIAATAMYACGVIGPRTYTDEPERYSTGDPITGTESPSCKNKRRFGAKKPGTRPDYN